MKKIKYGVKLWSANSDLYGDFVRLYKRGKVDYLELLFVTGKSEGIEILKDNHVPMVIHAPTFNQKVLFGGKNFKENNSIFVDLMKFADSLGSDKVILHPDIGRKEFFVRFLDSHKDRRVVIENMPKLALDGSTCLGHSFYEIKEFLNIGDFGFCLDFAHATKAAIGLNKDPKGFIKEFLKLKPCIFHLSDGHMGSEIDEHLNLGEGNFDLRFLKQCINNSGGMVTLETPKKDGLDQDIKNIEYFKKL